jgi:hypothetical protein
MNELNLLYSYFMIIKHYSYYVIIFSLFQIQGHQRSPSDTQAFKERTKCDALVDLQTELGNILSTTPDNQKESFEKQQDGFKKLFERFLEEGGPSLDWNQIQKLPNDAVCSCFFSLLKTIISFYKKYLFNFKTI